MNPSPALPDLVPVRMLNEFVYCPRLCWLEWVESEFEDSVDTIEGRHVHRRVDAGPNELLPDADEAESARPVTRSVLCSSTKEGLIARLDLLEVSEGRALPVEYKKGVPPDNEHRAWDPERVQLCAQALILRDAGWRVDQGLIWFAGNQEKVEVPIDAALEELTRSSLAQMREFEGRDRPPPPLVDSPKCVGCSLSGICLPDELHLLEAQEDPAPEVRRLAPARDLGVPLHVTQPGARIGKRGERLEITCKGEKVGEARLRELCSVSTYGSVQVTAQARDALADAGVPLCSFSTGGWFRSITTGTPHKNILIRIAQHRTAEDPASALGLARRLISGKINNSRTLLRRNASGLDPAVLKQLSGLAKKAHGASALDSLLGIEGTAARLYYANFPTMLKTEELAFTFDHRNRRPPRDPVNAVLSFLYAVLARECTTALLVVGFDPYRGFLHQPRYGRPALALDLAEEFRSIVSDSTALTLINKQEIQPSHFVIRSEAAALTPEGRRAVLRAHERRMESLVRHPRFDYAISYRRIIEVQARLLSRHLLGDVESYESFTTR